jgi:hypothetical protein
MASRSRSPRRKPVPSYEHDDAQRLSPVLDLTDDPFNRITTFTYSVKELIRPRKSPTKTKGGSAR